MTIKMRIYLILCHYNVSVKEKRTFFACIHTLDPTINNKYVFSTKHAHEDQLEILLKGAAGCCFVPAFVCFVLINMSFNENKTTVAIRA